MNKYEDLRRFWLVIEPEMMDKSSGQCWITIQTLWWIVDRLRWQKINLNLEFDEAILWNVLGVLYDRAMILMIVCLCMMARQI